MKDIITKHVLEIRYEPNPGFLDRRGGIASSLSPKIFRHWRISENQIELFNPDSQINAFFSYKNIGLSNIYPETTEEFISTSKDLIKESWTHFSFNKIQRIGVRSGFLCPKDISFKKLFNSFNKNFVNSSFVDNQSIFGTAKLIDIGLNLNFSVGSEYFNIMTGPMEKKQIKEFFPGVKDLPDQGVYLEIDYFKNEFSPSLKQKDVLNLLDNAITQGKSIFNTISDLVEKGYEK